MNFWVAKLYGNNDTFCGDIIIFRDSIHQVLPYLEVTVDPGYVGGVKDRCCMLHGILQHCTNTMSKVS